MAINAISNYLARFFLIRTDLTEDLDYNTPHTPGSQQPSRKARSQLNPITLLMG
jgi:hypothetical protein